MIFKKKLKNIFITFIIIGFFSGLVSAFIILKQKKVASTNQEEYKLHCASCHLLPDPNNIPKNTWENNVLPEMAMRMGLVKNNLGESYLNKGNQVIKSIYSYPHAPMVDSLQWERLKHYILSIAPTKIENNPKRKGRATKLTQFSSSLVNLNDSQPIGGIVSLSYDKIECKLLIGDYYGQLHEWKKEVLSYKINSPLISILRNENEMYLTGIGIMDPSEISKGIIYKVDNDTIKPIVDNLHRPVFLEINDLNENGENEIIVCEFGHLTGELSVFVKNTGNYDKETLLAVPGSVNLEIADMNNDGKKDIIALFAQGSEGIYIFYQKENLKFETKHIIGMGPEYGSSWFSIVDYNGDGFKDIILANGDNADYSIFLKPYHGIRLFINDGKNNFNEEWFYPINGATKVLAEDFDLDGDIDFAVASFFPDSNNYPEEGFVYLENKDASNYIFTPQITQSAKNGNWLVMEKGDYDQDGDIDLMLGNFSKPKSNRFNNQTNFDLLYLENKRIRN